MKRAKRILALLLCLAMLFALGGAAEEPVEPADGVEAVVEEAVEEPEAEEAPVEEAVEEPIAEPAEEPEAEQAPVEEAIEDQAPQETEEAAPGDEATEDEAAEGEDAGQQASEGESPETQEPDPEPQEPEEEDEALELEPQNTGLGDFVVSTGEPCTDGGEHDFQPIAVEKVDPDYEGFHIFLCTKCGVIDSYTDFHSAPCTAPGKCEMCGYPLDEGQVRHSFENREYQYVNAKYHGNLCKDCGRYISLEEHSASCTEGQPGICDFCGAAIPGLKVEHNVQYEEWGYYDSRSHVIRCDDCGEIVETQEHYAYCDSDEPGVCDGCGADIPGLEVEHYVTCESDDPDYCEGCGQYMPGLEVEHDIDLDLDFYEYYDEQYHAIFCETCGEYVMKEKHYAACADKGKGICVVCDHKVPGLEVEHSEDLERGFERLDSRYHALYCKSCGEVIRTEEHSAICGSDGTPICTVCGGEAADATLTHDFDYDTPVYIDESHHGYKCRRCGAFDEGRLEEHRVRCDAQDDPICEDCGGKAPRAAVVHDFDYDTAVYYDEYSHGYKCRRCGEFDEDRIWDHFARCVRNGRPVCEACGGAVQDYQIDHAYDYLTAEYVNANYHGYRCTRCGEIDKYTLVEHYAYCDSEEEGVCNECGGKVTGHLVILHYEPDPEEGNYCYLDSKYHVLHCEYCDAILPETKREHFAYCNPDGVPVCEYCEEEVPGVTPVHSPDYDHVVRVDSERHGYRCMDCGELCEYEAHAARCGGIQGICGECGAPTQRIEHVADEGRGYKSNRRYHWQICIFCGEKMGVAPHYYSCRNWTDSPVCDECGAPVPDDVEPTHNINYQVGDYKNSNLHTVMCKDCGYTEDCPHTVPCNSKTPKVCAVCGKKGTTKKEHSGYIKANATKCWFYCTQCKKKIWNLPHSVTCYSGGRCINCGIQVAKAKPAHEYVNGFCVYCDAEAKIEYPGLLTLTAKQSASPKATGAVDKGFLYKSSNTSVVKINAKGKITAVAKGEAEIYVTGKTSGRRVICAVTVLPMPTAIRLEGGQSLLNLGEELRLTALVEPGDALQKVKWKASNGNVTVADGRVTPNKPGKVTITATTEAKGKKGKKLSAKLALTVVDPTKPREVKIDEGSAIALYQGMESLTLHATIIPETAAAGGVTWSIPQKQQKIATIDENGVLKPVAGKSGTVTVTATSKEKKENKKFATAKIKVTVGADPQRPFSVALDKQGPVELKVGETLTLSASIEPATATEQTGLTWGSSNKNIASVANGVVTGVKKGTATITVKTANGKKASIKIKIVP